MNAFVFMVLFASQAFASGGAVGNGGDAVVCRPSSQNKFNGYYALDYLAKYQSNLDAVPAASIEQALNRIEAGLHAKLPELWPSFREFRNNVFNTRDFTRKHIWEEAAFGLVDLKDEALVERLPENCRAGDKIAVVQAVIRQPPSVAGLPEYKVKYKFVPQVTEALRRQNPVQLSFLIVHEWLWDFSKNVDRNRVINYLLHS
ncbi:MAG TPA: hypothetical protein VFV50_19365, partial [Bdellovibrionales bacterium]|nr:hypothetical protein [Bdellovibrionales bacterium]